MNTIFDNFTGEVNLSIFRPSSDVPGVNLRRQYLSLVGLLQYVDIINGDLTGNLPDNITEQTVKGMISHCIGDLKVREEMSTEQPEPEIPDDEIWYTSSDGDIIEPNPNPASFGANIISNTYEGDKGIIKFDGSVTEIGKSAFDSCTGLTSITIPNSVTEIGESAFDTCTGLTSITIPDSVTVIGEFAFDECTGLTSIIVNPNNTTYDSRDNCNAIIHTANNMLIRGCKNTTIPDSVTSIGGSAFSYCYGLTSITIPNSVTEIREWAFVSCTGLTSITIPDSVTSIGEGVFSDCTGLTSITCLNTTPPTLGNSAFDNIDENYIIYVPAGSVDAYKEAWSDYTDHIQAIVE